MGLLPLGTGNDFARAAGIPLDPRAAAVALTTARPHRFDLLEDDTGRVVVNAAHAGLGAEAAAAAAGHKPRLGPLAYPLGALLAGLREAGWALQGLCDFMRLVIGELGLRSCVILSGDVHYGLNVQATFAYDAHVLSIAQLVSSGLKHSGTMARTALHLLGSAVRPDHARVGWETPPAMPQAGRARRLLDRLLRRRAVNTDAWAEDAPVFLPPTLAERIAAEQPPRLQETRSYVRPDGHRTRVVIGDNNVGLVSVRRHDGVVVHRLLARRAGRTMPHTASLPMGSVPRSPTDPPGVVPLHHPESAGDGYH